MDKYIKFDNVDLTYPNGYHALKNVSFDVNKGEIVALIGPSGAGKSTILNALPAMYPISSGEITIKGSKLTKAQDKESIKKIRKITGYIFQSKNVVKERTAFENVMSGYYSKYGVVNKIFRALFNTSFYKNKDLMETGKGTFSKYIGNISYEFTKMEAKQLTLKTLQEVGLEHLAFEKVANLSGGQEQRVALARVLISNPEIILADEPVSALDVINAEKVLTSIRQASINHGLSTIINLHHVDLAIKYTDKIIGVAKGKVVWEGTPDQLTTQAIKTIYGEEFNEIDDEFIAESLAAKYGNSKNTKLKLADKKINSVNIIKPTDENVEKKKLKPNRAQLRKLTIIQLKRDAKRLGAKNYSSAKKEELVDMVFKSYRK